jgi:glycosyltransferase involved in cell wall biosynthesis
MAPERFTKGLVSIVIPTFNQADYLTDALACVQRQTFVNWEAIVVNNYSNDNTISTVESFNDRRIQLINFANNGIIARSRNLAMNNARGEFIAFLDSDDLWKEEKLAQCVDVLERGADLVCHAERWFGGGAADRIVKYGPSGSASYEALLTKGNCISTSATVVRHTVIDAVGGFRDNPDFVTTEDYDLWLRIAKRGHRIEFIEETLGSFRRHTSSASSSTLRHLHAELAVLDDHFVDAPEALRLKARQRRAFAYYAAARGFTKNADLANGLRMFGTSLRLNPFLLRAWVGLIVHLMFVPMGLRRT